MNTRDVTSVVAKNSIDFIRKVFHLYANKKLFAIDRTGTTLDGFQSLVVQEKVYVDDDHGWLCISHQLDTSNEAAQIVFTSGTEGTPKAILLSYKNLADVIHRLNGIMEVNSDIREYIGVPVSYSFGLGRCRAVAAAGGSFYIPANGFNPVEIRQMLQQDEINAISAVPSLWRIILDAPGIIGDLGTKVRWIEIGSQYMAAEEKRRMKALFPEAKIVQHYGLTEASRSTFLDISETEDVLLESVGFATGSVATKISAQGNICIRGDNVALGQLDNRGQLFSLTNDDGWLQTKDVGRMERGYLWYQGRSDDQINIGGIKLSPDKLELELAQEFRCASQIALVGVNDRLYGMKILLAYRSEVDDNLTEIEQYLLKKLHGYGIQAGNSLILFPVEEFPVTATGKIQRKKIAALYELQGHTKKNELPRKAIKLSDDEEAIASLWCEVLGELPVQRTDNFIDIGGDSLSTLQVIIKMERKGYDNNTIQTMLLGHSLADIAETVSCKLAVAEREVDHALPSETVMSWSLNALRGIMVSIVLLGHWGPGLWARLFGTYGERVDNLLNPLYRMGTPGFAIIFGIGVGYYFIDQNNRTGQSNIIQRIRSIFILVLLAWLLLSSVHLIENLLNRHAFTGLLLGNSFYNILCYYLLAIASIPMWRSWLRKIPFSHVVSAVGIALSFWLIHQGVVAFLPSEQLNSVLELPRLMLVAKYGYFRVGTAAFLGIALGCWLRSVTVDEICRTMIPVGAGFFIAGLLTTLDFMSGHQLEQVKAVPLSMVFWYFGAEILFLSFIVSFMRFKQQRSDLINIFLNVLIVMGVLALPIFAFHGIVIPVKDILVNLGVAGKVALALPLGVFLVCFLYGGARLYRIYFTVNLNN